MRLLHILPIILLGASLIASEIPAQFQAWGDKVDKLLVDAVTIPEGYNRVIPSSANTTMPELKADATQGGVLTFTSPAFEKVYPESLPFKEHVNRPMRAFATPGEYVSMQSSIRALDKDMNLNVKIVPPSGLPEQNIDVRVVRYLAWPDGKDKRYHMEPRYLEHLDADNKINLSVGNTETLWLTIKIPDNFPAGRHQGALILSAAGIERRIPIQLLILPFQLKQPDPYKDISFSVLSNDNDSRSKARFTRNLYMEHMPKHFTDMKEHGMNSAGYFHVNPYFALKDGKLQIDYDRPGYCSLYSMAKVMDELKKAGLNGPFIYQKGPLVWAIWAINAVLSYKTFTPELDDIYIQLAKSLELEAKKREWPEPVFFIGDEPGSHADRLKRDMHYGSLLKKDAPGIRISNFFNSHSPGGEDWRYLAPVSDILCAHSMSTEIIEKGKAVGYKEFWSYASTTAGRELAVDRCAYGFYPWAIDLKGVTQFIYQTGSENPFDRLNQEEHFYYAYPGAEGPVPAIHWEAVRQGTYDYRYLLTLNSIIEKCRKSGKADAEKKADEAQKVMDRIVGKFAEASNNTIHDHNQARNGITDGATNATMNIYRWQLADAIVKLQEFMNK